MVLKNIKLKELVAINLLALIILLITLYYNVFLIAKKFHVSDASDKNKEEVFEEKIDELLKNIAPLVENLKEKKTATSIESKDKVGRVIGENIRVDDSEHFTWKVIERLANTATLYNVAFSPKYEEVFTKACDNYFSKFNKLSAISSFNSCVDNEAIHKEIVLFDTSSARLTQGAIDKI